MTYCAACSGHGTNVHDPDCPVTNHAQTIRDAVEAYPDLTHPDEIYDCERVIADALDALVADLARYRTALEEAADDLDKAANVFDGLGFSLNTAHFAGRAERARAALAGAEKEAGA